MTSCPCGSKLSFNVCCEPIIKGAAASSPEALMRSRYSAFVTGNIDHIVHTHAPEIIDDFNRAEAERAAAEITWLGLEIKSASESGDIGSVEFFVRFRRDDQELAQHEIAHFRREHGRWLYVNGVVNPKTSSVKVDKYNRNDPCHCGSGKKYKKCCGA